MEITRRRVRALVAISVVSAAACGGGDEAAPPPDVALDAGGARLDASAGAADSAADAAIAADAAPSCDGVVSGGTGADPGENASTATNTIKAVTPSASSVERYRPLIVDLKTSAQFKNGFDPNEVAVDLYATSACGETIVQPCFWQSTAGGEASWQCRFAPRHEGVHTYHVALTDSGGASSTTAMTVAVTPATTDGFLHADKAHAKDGLASSAYAFRFDSGRAWRGVGEDVAWEIDPYKFPTVLPRLHDDGLNVMRIWHSSWSLPIEWGLGANHYNQDSAAYFDEIVKLAEENGVYLMVTLNDYRDYHEHWADNVYNKAKGGWCNTGGEFFSNATAKEVYKKRLRYYVARWGYSPAIQSFELFNEIDNAMIEDNSIKAADLTPWVAEMSAHLHAIDPYDHLVTASISYVDVDFWQAPGIDFTQTHLYGPNNRIAKLPTVNQQYQAKFKKPYVCGEFSKRWESANEESSDSYRQELHYGMWLGAVQASPILPMTWWWDSHWKWGDDFVLKSVAGFSNDILAKAGTGALDGLATTATGSGGGLQSGGLLAAGKYGYVWTTNYGRGGASNVTLTITGLRAGSNAYAVEAYDTWKGGFSAPNGVTSKDGTLTIDVGALAGSGSGSDAAYRITDVAQL